MSDQLFSKEYSKSKAKENAKSKVATETATKDNMALVAGETTTQAKTDSDKIEENPGLHGKMSMTRQAMLHLPVTTPTYTRVAGRMPWAGRMPRQGLGRRHAWQGGCRRHASAASRSSRSRVSSSLGAVWHPILVTSCGLLSSRSCEASLPTS